MSRADQLNFATLLNLLVHLVEEEEQEHDRDALRPNIFHPSQLANTCIRQAYLQKLGLVDLPSGPARVGTMIHEFIEDKLPLLAENHADVLQKLGIDPSRVANLEIEQKVTADLGGIVLKGQYDVFDPVDEMVVDWKTKRDLQHVHPPVQEHIEQLTLYMHMAGASAGQLVYIQRDDLSVQQYPSRDDARCTIAYDEQRFKQLIARAWYVRQAIEKYGIATTRGEIPFEKCGCWKCNNEDETLDLPDKTPAFKFPPRDTPPACLDEATLANAPTPARSMG
jgi:CRISPR-associated exonuclease Cas4